MKIENSLIFLISINAQVVIWKWLYYNDEDVCQQHKILKIIIIFNVFTTVVNSFLRY